MKHAHSGVRRSVGTVATLALVAGTTAVLAIPTPAQVHGGSTRLGPGASHRSRFMATRQAMSSSGGRGLMEQSPG